MILIRGDSIKLELGDLFQQKHLNLHNQDESKVQSSLQRLEYRLLYSDTFHLHWTVRTNRISRMNQTFWLERLGWTESQEWIRLSDWNV